MITNTDAILSKVAIEDVARDYVELTRHGMNLVGKCPFPEHQEKTGSFTVSPGKGIYKCFGCGKGGNNAAKFLMDLKGYTFPEAMIQLSAKSGVQVEFENGKNSEEVIQKWKESKEKEKQLQDTMSAVVEVLKDHRIQPDREIVGKTYTKEMIDKWMISFIDKNILSSSKLSKEHLMEMGLINQNQSGRYYDSYIKRVIFPIRHLSGFVIGVTGRATDPDHKAKYINSPESLLYNKSQSVFGLWENSKSINDKEFVYLVEGATDVIMLDQHGIGNAVAPLGTALTEEQVKRIGRYTNTIILLRDGDAAGKKAALRDVDIIVKQQLQVAVLILPEGEDPASYIIKVGVDEFKEYGNKNTVDGLIFRIKNELNGKTDPYSKEAAIKLSSRLLSMIESETVREDYIKLLMPVIGCNLKTLVDSVNQEVNNKLSKTNKLSPEQENSKVKYGIYKQFNRFFNFNGYAISNFVINPLFLVRAGENSFRVFELINEDNLTVLLNLNSKSITKLSAFKDEIEKHGAYVYEGDEKDYTKIKKLIYSGMEKIYALDHLGYISQSNVYAWGNGITTPEGTFIPVDEYGKVVYGEYQYYLPAFSKIGKQEKVINENDSDFEKKFIYVNSDENFKAWVDEFSDLFEVNSPIAIGFYVAACFRDFIQKKNNCFPILNLFGPPGSGKSTMGHALNVLFGLPIDAIPCPSATDASFFRRVSQCANAIMLYEEYSEKVDPKKQEGLKNFFDGFARPLAKRDSSTKTESTTVLGAPILIGQILPTHDPALLERCITVFFKAAPKNKDRSRKLEKYMKRGKKGYFSKITSEIHSKREQILEKFSEIYEDQKSHINTMFGQGKEPDPRVLMNYCVVMSFYIAAMEVFNIKFKLSTLHDDIYARLKEQKTVNEGATELLEFWGVLAWMIDNKKLNPDFYAIESHKQITIRKEGDDSTQLAWENPKKIFFIKVSHVHKEYLIAAKSQGLVRTLDANSIKHYLRINRAFLGEVIKNTNGKTARMWAFDTEAIPSIELEPTNFKEQDEFAPKPVKNDHDLFTPAETPDFS